MTTIEDFDQALTKSERQVMAQLTTPNKIQAFLDKLTYSVDANYRCPLRVFREGIAHCFDGALFVAAALRRGRALARFTPAGRAGNSTNFLHVRRLRAM